LGSWIDRGDIYSYSDIWILTLKRIYAEGLQQRRRKKEIGIWRIKTLSHTTRSLRKGDGSIFGFQKETLLYRSLRRRGVTIRKPVDCMIASVAIEHDIPLLHNDRDFDPIETHCGLKVARISKKPTKPSKRRPEGRA